MLINNYYSMVLGFMSFIALFLMNKLWAPDEFLISNLKKLWKIQKSKIWYVKPKIHV
jgi:hypothetical protein